MQPAPGAANAALRCATPRGGGYNPPMNKPSTSAHRRTLFPAIEPYRSGHLRVSPVHEIYWEECGNPRGKPRLMAYSKMQYHLIVL